MGKQVKKDEELSSKYRGVKVNGKKMDAHRHLMETLIGRPLDKDEVVHHRDGNPLNNSPDNLVVMTRSEHTKLHMRDLPNLHTLTPEQQRENTTRAWERGVFEHLKKPVVAFNKRTGELFKIYNSSKEAEADGFLSGHIGSCCNGKRKSHKGMIWKHLSDCPELSVP